ncbi:MAG: hypothetical protein LBS53_13510 [Synergistaceae bacterium]|jgi:hypothetical protein|nr:hypothetical protein [Synergistaceae bacterium]
MNENKPKAAAIAESVFDALYLVSGISIAVLLLAAAGANHTRALYGAMALTLIAGDAFHLTPRILSVYFSGNERLASARGIGLCVTSITMTVFYLLLYEVYVSLYGIPRHALLSALIYTLAAARVILCLMPANDWLGRRTGENRWSLYRNIPFLALGMIVAALFAVRAFSGEGGPLSLMWLAITLSFAFYIPVVLLAKKRPAVGMLMLPKTCVYIWMLIMGLSL